MTTSTLPSDVHDEPRPSALVITNWVPKEKGTLLGSFHVIFPDGLVIMGCMVHASGRGPQVMLPGAAQVRDNGELMRRPDGKLFYKTLIKFTSLEVFKLFEAAVVEELRRLGHIQ
jgi:hypothetical protein